MPDSSQRARKKRRILKQQLGEFDISFLVYIPAHMLTEVKPVVKPKLTIKEQLTYERMLNKIYDNANKEQYGNPKSDR